MTKSKNTRGFGFEKVFIESNKHKYCWVLVFFLDFTNVQINHLIAYLVDLENGSVTNLVKSLSDTFCPGVNGAAKKKQNFTWFIWDWLTSHWLQPAVVGLGRQRTWWGWEMLKIRIEMVLFVVELACWLAFFFVSTFDWSPWCRVSNREISWNMNETDFN